MAPAVRGVTTTFLLNPNTATQLIGPLPDPDGYLFLRIDNLSKTSWVAFAVGMNGGASAQHHQIPPSSFYEFKVNFQFPFPERNWGIQGDVSAIAVTGNPMISFLAI